MFRKMPKARQRSKFGKKPRAMLKYKARNRPNAKSRTGPRLERDLSLGRGIRRCIRLGGGRSFKRDLSIRILSLGRGPSLRKCPSKSSLGRGLKLTTCVILQKEACVKSRFKLSLTM